MQAAETKIGTVNWNLDPAHSSVGLAVRHMGLFAVKGTFEKVSGTAQTVDGKLTAVEATIEAGSLNTANADRDAHLKSDDFLSAATYPNIVFKSTRIEPSAPGHFKVTGDLTIRDQTHPVTFEVETLDAVNDPWGLVRAGAMATGQISRKEWGLTWNQMLETGGLIVGDEVKFTLEVEATAAA